MFGAFSRVRQTQTLFSIVAGAAWLSLTLYETLRTIGWFTPVPFWSFWGTVMAGVDIVQNLVLFAPLGWIAQRARWPVWRVLIVAALLSASIEFAQQWVPGRTTTAKDMVCNTLGAALGFWMATRAVRPHARIAASFAVLGLFLWMHAMNTTWRWPAISADGVGVWGGERQRPCAPSEQAPGTRESTVCVVVPNTAKGGNKYVRIVGPQGRTYTRVQSFAYGRVMDRTDCVMMHFEWTRGVAQLSLRAPIVRACALVSPADSLIELRVDPRLERTADGYWVPTRAGVWMWPVWPFSDYHPALLRAVGALTFVVLVALFAGAAAWYLPLGYLAALTAMAIITGMRPPGLWELGWTALAWLVALGAVQGDAWWQAERNTPE